MANTNINIRMDTDLKKQFEAFCADMGMTMTTAFNIFVRQTLRQGKIPFEIYADPFYSDSNMRALDNSIKQAGQGKVVVKSMDELEQLADGN